MYDRRPARRLPGWRGDPSLNACPTIKPPPTASGLLRLTLDDLPVRSQPSCAAPATPSAGKNGSRVTGRPAWACVGSAGRVEDYGGVQLGNGMNCRRTTCCHQASNSGICAARLSVSVCHSVDDSGRPACRLAGMELSSLLGLSSAGKSALMARPLSLGNLLRLII